METDSHRGARQDQGMSRATERDEDFRLFVEAHWPALVRSAYLILGDHSAAEDLVQQTLATVYRHWRRRVREGAPLAYVRRAMVNHAISNSRRKRFIETSLDRVPEAGQHTPAVGMRGPGERDPYREIDDRDLVLRALRDLPAQMRAVVVLRYFDDLSEAATADALGISVGSVKSQTSRGLQRLRAIVAVGQTEGTYS